MSLPGDADDVTLLEDPQMRSLEVLRLKTKGHLENLEALQHKVDILVGLVSRHIGMAHTICSNMMDKQGLMLLCHHAAFGWPE